MTYGVHHALLRIFYFFNRLMYPFGELLQIIAGKTIFINHFLKLNRTLQNDLILFIEQEEFFIGLANIKNCYDRCWFHTPFYSLID